MNTLLRKAREDESGLTLIELLIVIIILGVLSAVIILAVGAFNNQGKEEACNTDRKTVEAGSESYFADVGSYPANVDVLVNAPATPPAGYAGPYLKSTPKYTFSINGTTGNVTENPTSQPCT